MSRRQTKRLSPPSAAPRGGPGSGARAASPAGRRKLWFPVLVFLALIGVEFAWFTISSGVPVDPPPARFRALARVTGAVLSPFQEGVQVREASVESPRFSMRVGGGCDAIEAMLAYVAAVLVSPATWTRRLIGVAAGVAAICAFNVGRLTSLFLIGVYARGLFDVMHHEVFQGLLIASIVALWIGWLRWAATPADAVHEANR